MKLRRAEVTRWMTVTAFGALALAAAWPAAAAGADKTPEGMKSGFVTATDGAKIHYIEEGQTFETQAANVGNPLPSGTKATKGEVARTAPHHGVSVLFIPGWTMPAWIYQKQLDGLSKARRVVAMDPRSQGESTKTTEGLYPAQMARDIHSVIEQLHLAPVVIVGWSMAVVETIAYVDQFGTSDVAGLVLIDDVAGGNEPGDEKFQLPMLKGVLENRKDNADYFVRKIQFHRPQPEDYIQKVIAASLTVPTSNAVTLLVGRFAADYRSTLPKIDKPVMICAAKPNDFYQREVAMKNAIPGAQIVDFEGDGHALFVDDPEKFNAAMEDFLLDLN
ncbi:MAG: alpha/beta hydrolase [Candidatus Acidiferrales bacterium]|jgi:microsomal epoxide hydrolase